MESFSHRKDFSDMTFAQNPHRSQEHFQKRQFIQMLKISPTTNNKAVSQMTLKRNFFRQQRRKQYLNNYFEKKRADLFGWYSDSFATNGHLEKGASEDIEIDRDLREQVANKFSENLNYKPAYNSKYFDNVVLLEKLIEQKQEKEIGHPDKFQFKHDSFCAFVIDTIQQSLDESYFTRFNNPDIFQSHFTALKHLIYSNLLDEVQKFLIALQQYNSILDKKNSFAYNDMCFDTYQKLIFQLTKFMKSENLVYTVDQKWPAIQIQEQLYMLLKIFIQITYYDDDVFQQKKRCNEDYESQSVKTLNEKYGSLLNISEKYDEPISLSSVLLQKTDLLQSLKFLIVFGPPYEANADFTEEQSHEDKRRKERVIMGILNLLMNISINVGSDILFEEGIIGQLKCILNDQSFRVDIRRRKGLSRNKDYSERPLLYYKIQEFLIESFELIRKEESLAFLSNMDSFKFVYDVLKEITLIRRHRKVNKIQRHSVFVTKEIVLIEENEQQQIRMCLSQQSNDEDTMELNAIYERLKDRELVKFAQKCIDCLKRHLRIGEINLKSNLSRFWRTNNEIQFVSNGVYNQQFQNDINSSSQTVRFSSNNPYIVKLEYMMVDESLFQEYERGLQLLNKIKQ